MVGARGAWEHTLEAKERLMHLREHGPTERAFTFKQFFEAPVDGQNKAQQMWLVKTSVTPRSSIGSQYSFNQTTW